ADVVGGGFRAVLADELYELALESQLVPDALALVEIEALQVELVRLGGVAVAGEQVQDDAADVLPLLPVPGRGLDLWIDTDVLAATLVHPLDQLQLLFQGRDLEGRGPLREAVREDDLAASRVEPLGDPELLQLGQGEVDRVIAAVGALAVGEAARHVGDAVHVDVMEHDGDAV